MKVAEKKDYTLITSDEHSFSDFMSVFETEHVKHKEKHLIVQISEKFNPTKQNILLFLDCVDIHQSNGTSFVIVLKGVDIDEFPETLNIVPTLIEAEDVIEMENIQRDLGF